MNGPPVALVHGWGSTAERTWPDSGLTGGLAATGRAVLRLPLPGHRPGASRRPEDYARIDTDLETGLSDQAPHGSVDAVGFSLGGKLLLRIASRRPDRFRRLAVLGVGANLFAIEAGAAVSTALRNGPPPGAGHDFVSVVREAQSCGVPAEALAAVITRPPSLLRPEDLAALTLPVLLVVGDDDTIAGDPAPVAAALPDARLVRVPGLAHAETPFDVRVHDLVLEHLSQP